jgi:hypothetical protein
MFTSLISVVVRDSLKCQVLNGVDEWDALTWIASVSADPRTVSELGLSWLRYRPEEPLESLDWQTPDTIGDKWLLVDLACLRLQSNVEDLIPLERSAFQRDEGPTRAENPAVWVNLPPGWTIETIESARPTLPPIPPTAPPLDFRAILYGPAWTADFARRMSERFAAGECPESYFAPQEIPWEADRDDPRRAVAQRWHALSVQVHADWLMTPREDLGGENPRAFLHRGREWAQWEVEGRQRQWSIQRRAPRPLDRDTYAYRFGPMDLTEVVVYFDLCREVLDHGWSLLHQQPRLRTEVGKLAELLYEHAQTWLREGSIDDDPTPPAQLIESSRRHMPQLAGGTHLDCDCPLCRMLVEGQEDPDGMFYPTFSGFDGHHLELDGEFAFSLYETREEFDAAQAEYQDLEDSLDSDLGLDEEPPATEQAAEDESVWTGYVAPRSKGVSTMDLAFRMTEFIGDLKSGEAGAAPELARPWIEALNDRFDRLRNASPDPTDRAVAMTDLASELEQAAAEFPRLRSKSSDLQSLLHEWLRQPVPDLDDDLAG